MRRAGVVDGFGLVDEEVPGSFGEDYEFLLRGCPDRAGRTVPEVGVVVRWHKQSYFTSRWDTMAQGLSWLLERYPEFSTVPAGEARVAGQVAFARAAQGDRREVAALGAPHDPHGTRSSRGRTSRSRSRPARCSPDAIIRRLHDRGRGI